MIRQLPLSRIAFPSPARGLAQSRWARGGLAAAAAGAAILLGGALGLLATAVVLRTDRIGTERVGPWQILTDVGTPAINPYQRARMAHDGAIPLAASQGLTAVARVDDAGRTLDGRCSYRLDGPVPAAGFWTLEAASPAGRGFDNQAGRQSFTADDVLRDERGRVAIALSPSAMPGNWLPLAGSGAFTIVLRLYETALVNTGTAREAAWPGIARLQCP